MNSSVVPEGQTVHLPVFGWNLFGGAAQLLTGFSQSFQTHCADEQEETSTSLKERCLRKCTAYYSSRHSPLPPLLSPLLIISSTDDPNKGNFCL